MGVEALAAVFTAISVAIIVLSRIVEHYAFGKKNGSITPDTMKVMVDEAISKVCSNCKMHDLITKTDDDGTPLIYTPRSVARHQEDIMETQRRIATSIELQTQLLDRIERKITS